MEPKASTSRLRWATGVLVLAALYVAAARLGLALALPPARKATPVWPPSGIALAAVLFWGRSAWPGVWLGAFAANVWDAFTPGNPHPLATHAAVAFGIATGSTLQALAGAALLRGRGPALLERSQDVFHFVGAVAAACGIAASVGVATLGTAGLAPWSQAPLTWWTWWVGDVTGMLLVTPLVWAWRRGGVALPARRAAEATVLLVLGVGVGLAVFGAWGVAWRDAGAGSYLTIPLLLWAAFRFGPRGATVCLVLVAGMAILGTARGEGPFAGAPLTDALLRLQLFVGVVAVTTLALCAVLAERRAAGEALRRWNEDLERQVEGRTADLRRALEEKEVLLQEVHHRVQNNLQLVCTLLDLQAGDARDEAAVSVLRESRDRVQAMALVHERLYRSDDLARVDFGAYLAHLVETLFRSYTRPDGRVRLETSIAGLVLPVHRAIPCGLAAGELMTNSLKHAFPAGRSGRIRVEARAVADGFHLAVADDGVGLPAGFDVQAASSLGWRIVRTLARQVKARLVVERDAGTSVRLEVPAEPGTGVA